MRAPDLSGDTDAKPEGVIGETSNSHLSADDENELDDHSQPEPD